MRRPEPARLRQLPLFSSLSDEECTALVPLAYELVAAPGEVLVGQGDAAWEFFGLLEGSARVLRDGRTVGQLGPGDFFGEIALVGGGSRTATVEATSDVRLLIIPSEHFEQLIAEKPDIAERIRAALQERVRATLGRDALPG